MSNLPCIHCDGKILIVVSADNYTNKYRIRCMTCSATGPPSMTVKGAWDWWNSRVEDDEVEE